MKRLGLFPIDKMLKKNCNNEIKKGSERVVQHGNINEISRKQIQN